MKQKEAAKKNNQLFFPTMKSIGFQFSSEKRKKRKKETRE